MADKVISQRTVQKVIEGRSVTLTEKLHTKNPDGKRTIRSEYHEHMPHSAGGWLAGTITERVIEGRSPKVKTLIPEHRVG